MYLYVIRNTTLEMLYYPYQRSSTRLRPGCSLLQPTMSSNPTKLLILKTENFHFYSKILPNGNTTTQENIQKSFILIFIQKTNIFENLLIFHPIINISPKCTTTPNFCTSSPKTLWQPEYILETLHGLCHTPYRAESTGMHLSVLHIVVSMITHVQVKRFYFIYIVDDIIDISKCAPLIFQQGGMDNSI